MGCSGGEGKNVTLRYDIFKAAQRFLIRFMVS